MRWLIGSTRGRQVVFVSIVFTIAVAVPVLSSGFDHDETWQIGFLEGATVRAGVPLSVFHLWTFADGSDEELERLRAQVVEGRQPWCTDVSSPLDKMRFLRVLPSLGLTLDHLLFGVEAGGYHGHGLLWFTALLLAVGGLFAQGATGTAAGSLRPTLAAVALAAFALGPARTEVLARVATRHLVMAVFLGVLGLIAHLRHREQNWIAGRWLAPLLFGAGLLCGENLFQVLAYVLAFELLRSAEPWPIRLRALLPTVLLVGVYVVVYRVLDFGANGNGYVDPFSEPWTLARLAPLRFADLWLEETLRIPAWYLAEGNPWRPAGLPLAPWSRMVLATVTLFGLGLVAGLVRTGARDEHTRRTAAWMLLGAVLSIVIALPGQPGPRLLLVPGIGVAFVVLAGVRELLERVRTLPIRRAWLPAAIALIVLAVYGLLSPLSLIRQLGTYRRITTAITERWVPPAAIEPAQATPPSRFEEARDVLVLSVPSTSVPGSGFPAVRTLVEDDRRVFRPDGQRWWFLANNMIDFELLVRRIDAVTLELELGRARNAEPLTETLWIGCPANASSPVRLGPMTVEVLDRTPQGPRKIHVELDQPLEESALQLATWWQGAVRPIPVPAVGQGVVLALDP